MRKRVAMAASLIHHPELFLMDEPFEGVDAVGARLMKDILQDQVRRGATIFLTTHVLEVVERLCDRVAIIDHGQDRPQRHAGGAARRRRVAGGRFRADRRRGAPAGTAGLAMIGAILRAQWLTMRFGGRGRGITILVGLLWYGLWTVAARWRRRGGAVRCRDACASDSCRWDCSAICAYWQLMPILSASMGSALDLRKLLAYPIPHRKLFIVEVLLRFTTALEMVLVLAGGVAGLLGESGGGRMARRIAAS